jgi:arsenate reductase (thioredoxin)
VLIVCTGNSMRSQMGEGLLRTDLGDQIEVFSAGTNPSGVHPFTIKAMTEIGIDISHHTSKHVKQFEDRDVDLVITVCDHAHEVCPVFPFAKKAIHIGYPDPIRTLPGKSMDETFAEIRDQMRVELKEAVIRELNLKKK